MIAVLTDQSSLTITGPTNSQYEEPLNAIGRWLRQDHYKARLSIIHAGAIFWHVRRYSVRSPLEPDALFIAAIVLWAYCAYNRMTSAAVARPPENTRTELQSKDLTDISNLIQIDRPCDDELVQTFIRKGDQMQPYMTRVGSLSNPEAAVEILKIANELMGLCCSLWLPHRRYQATLSLLAETKIKTT